ncbi:CsbD family protein [Streptomyces sp. NPDC001514]
MTKGKSKAQQLKGKMKETLGKATHDRSMKREGRGEMLRGKAHEMAEKAADQIRKRTKH